MFFIFIGQYVKRIFQIESRKKEIGKGGEKENLALKDPGSHLTFKFKFIATLVTVTELI